MGLLEVHNALCTMIGSPCSLSSECPSIMASNTPLNSINPFSDSISHIRILFHIFTDHFTFSDHISQSPKYFALCQTLWTTHISVHIPSDTASISRAHPWTSTDMYHMHARSVSSIPGVMRYFAIFRDIE